MTDDLYYRKMESTSTTDLVDMIRERDERIEELEDKLTMVKQLLAFWVDDFYDRFDDSDKYEERHKALVEAEQFLKEE